LGYFHFMLSVPVQLIAWKDRPRNDVLCVQRDTKQLLTHSLTHSLLQREDREKISTPQLQCCVNGVKILRLLRMHAASCRRRLFIIGAFNNLNSSVQITRHASVCRVATIVAIINNNAINDVVAAACCRNLCAVYLTRHVARPLCY